MTISPPGFSVAVAGILAITGNVLGVAFLRSIPHAYKAQSLAVWLAELSAAPRAGLASAVSFAVGLTALAVFAAIVAALEFARLRGSPWLVAGAALIVAGALLNAAGSVLAAAATRNVSSPLPLLSAAVGADALFNALLGLGLLATGAALLGDPAFPRWIAWLGIVAGVASLPVAGQMFSDSIARLVLVSGPLWLFWIAAVSLVFAKR